MNDFITRPPDLSPLMAGATTTLLTGTLVVQFDAPAGATSIVLSLLLATLVKLEQRNVNRFHLLLFYLLNALTVYSVALGINTAGVAASRSGQESVVLERGISGAGQAHDDFFRPWL